MLTNRNIRGSGYAKITEEAWLVTKGCIKNVLNGKAFSKVIFNLKAGALKSLLMEVFCEKENDEIHQTCLLTFIYS